MMCLWYFAVLSKTSDGLTFNLGFSSFSVQADLVYPVAVTQKNRRREEIDNELS